MRDRPKKKGNGPTGHGSSAEIVKMAAEVYRQNQGTVPLSDERWAPEDRELPERHQKPPYRSGGRRVHRNGGCRTR